MADLPAPTPTTSDPVTQKTFKVVDVSDDHVFLALDDGRHILATVKDGVEGVKRHAHVAITNDGLDDEGAPKNPVITRVIPRG